MNPERILAVKLSSFGDVVRVTPCLRALRARWPASKLFLAVDRSLAPLVARDPNLDGILENEPGGWWSALCSARPYRGFDLAVDFQGTRRSLAWMYACGARVRVGRGNWRPGWQLAVPNDLRVNDVADQAAILEKFGVPVADLSPRLYVDPDADARATARLRELGAPERGFLVVNPFSRWISKTWPADRFAEVIRRFTDVHGGPVIITGSTNERDAAEQLLKLAPPGRAISMAGTLTLAESVAVYSRAAVMLTGDSGPMHAAAALGVRVIALFGPTWPERSAPWGKEHIVIQRSRPDRHHAYRDRDGQSHMLAIDVETVSETLLKVWPS